MSLEERFSKLEMNFHILLKALYDSAEELHDMGEHEKNEFVEISALPLWTLIGKYQEGTQSHESVVEKTE